MALVVSPLRFPPVSAGRVVTPLAICIAIRVANHIATRIAPCSGWSLADLPMTPTPSLLLAAGIGPARSLFARLALALRAPLLVLPLLAWALPASLAEPPGSPSRAGTSPSSSPPAARPASHCQRLWGDGRSFQSLDFVQVLAIRLKSSRYDLLIRPDDYGAPLSSLSLRFPASFDGGLTLESLRLCRMLTPPTAHRTRCSETLPARVERSNPKEVLIIPQTPLSGAGTYGLSLVLFNPSVPDRYPLRLYAGSPETPELTYRGTWLIRITPEQD